MPNALITGAGGGIGSAIGAALAPTHSLLLGGRPSARLTELAQRLGASIFPLDLSHPDPIAAHTELPGDLDVLVHNAGVMFPNALGTTTAAEWRTTFDVNVLGAVSVTLTLLPALRRAHGQVVFINSGAGLRVSPGMASYSASKFALRAFADSLRADEPALRVTTVYPGRTATAMQRDLVAFEGGEYDPDRFLRPETVAGVVANVVATPPDGHVHEVVLRPR